MEREKKQDKLSSSERVEPLQVHFRRPPRTSEEALETLKEADQRFEMGKKYLVGKDGGNLGS